MIKDEKIQAIKELLLSLNIDEKDLEEKFVLASGSGGQKVQKTSSAVQLKHIPTGIIVKCSKTRNRSDNRWFARRLLCEKYIEAYQPSESKRKRAEEKIRKQKKRRKRRSSSET